MAKDANEMPEMIDLEALDLGPLTRHARTATFAPNWRAVLAADAFVGVIIAAIGVAIVATLGWYGWPLVVVGAVYIFLVVRRYLQWRWIRRKAGLPG